MKRSRLQSYVPVLALACMAAVAMPGCGARAPAPGMAVSGKAGGGWPRASAEGEGISADDWREAMRLVEQASPDVLLVARHGHLLGEFHGRGADAGQLLPGGTVSACVAWLAAGAALGLDRLPLPEALAAPKDQCAGGDALPPAIERAAGVSYATYLSRAIWQPLRAADARWDGAQLGANPTDWLRIGQALLADGEFQGTRIVPAGWVARILGPEAMRADPLQLPLAGGAGIWISSRRSLVVVAAGGPGDAAAIAAGAVMRAVRAPGATGDSLSDLVPGH